MKQQELLRAGLLGQQILTQQSELEARVRELSEVEARSGRGGGSDSDGEELGEETRVRLQALGEAVGGWEKENEGIWEGIRGGKVSPPLARRDLFGYPSDESARALSS